MIGQASAVTPPGAQSDRREKHEDRQTIHRRLSEEPRGPRQADKAQTELPDQVDTDEHADKLSRLDIDIEDLGMAAGGIGG